MFPPAARHQVIAELNREKRAAAEVGAEKQGKAANNERDGNTTAAARPPIRSGMTERRRRRTNLGPCQPNAESEGEGGNSRGNHQLCMEITGTIC